MPARTRTSAKAKPERQPARWTPGGEGSMQVLSSDGATWYEIAIDADRHLKCECKGYWGHGRCKHLGFAAEALEKWLDPSTPGQLAFFDATHDDPYRLQQRIARELFDEDEDEIPF